MSHIYSIKFYSAYFSVDAKNGRIERVNTLPQRKQVIDLTLSSEKSSFFAKRRLNRDAVTLLTNEVEKEAALETENERAQRIEEVAQKIFSRFSFQLEEEKAHSDQRRQKVLAHFIRYVLRDDSELHKTHKNFSLKLDSLEEIRKKSEQSAVLSENAIDLIFGEGFYRYHKGSQTLSEFCPSKNIFLPSRDQIDLNCGSVDVIENLRLVFDRRRHSQLKVAQNENKEFTQKLEPITKRGQQKDYNANKKAHHEKIQFLIKQSFDQLNANLNHLRLDEEKKQAVQSLLNAKIHVSSAISRMKDSLFDRKNSCPQGCLIADLICPELRAQKDTFKQAWKHLRDKVEALKNEFPENSEEVRKSESYQNSIKELKSCMRNFSKALEEYVIVQLEYSKSLGIPFKKIGKGTGGARFGYSLHGLRICVVKPEDEGPYGINNPTWEARFKRFIGKRPCIRDNLESLIETAAFQLDQQMDMCLVPPTSTVMLNSPSFINKAEKMCSVQMFVEGTQEFCDVAGVGAKSKRSHQKVWLEKQKADFENRFENSSNSYVFTLDDKRELKKLTFLHGFDITCIDTWGRYREVCDSFKERLAKIALLDHRLGNTDCHLENILFKIKKTEDARLQKFFKTIAFFTEDKHDGLESIEGDLLSDAEIEKLTDSLFLPPSETTDSLVFSFGSKTYQLDSNGKVDRKDQHEPSFRIGGLKNAQWITNLQNFIERRKGQHFSVDPSGALVEIDTTKKSRKELKEIQENVHQVLKESLKKMDDWLSKTSLKSQEKIAIQKVFSEAFSKKGSIGRLKSALFKSQMLKSCPFFHDLLKEEVKIPSLFHQLVDNLFDAKEGEAMLIKIDGGSALPHQHPKTYFEMKNAYGFEVLPQMKQKIPKALSDEKQDRKIIDSMLNLAALNFSTILDDNEYQYFLKKNETLALIKKWILKADVEFVKSQLVQSLTASHETQFAKDRMRMILSHKEGVDPDKIDSAMVNRCLCKQINARQKMFGNELERIRVQAQLLKERYELELANSVSFTPQTKEGEIFGNELRVAEALYEDQDLGTLFGAKLGRKMEKRKLCAEQIPELRERLKVFKTRVDGAALEGVTPLSEDLRRLPFAKRLSSANELYKSLVG